MRVGEVRIGDWVANWMMRETGPDDRDRWRPVILGYEDRLQSGQGCASLRPTGRADER